MKNILISGINLYQSMPISTHGLCKHIPSCSNYAKEAILEYGSLKGTFLAVKRICKCNSFNKNIYDPVPKRSVKNEKNY